MVGARVVVYPGSGVGVVGGVGMACTGMGRGMACTGMGRGMASTGRPVLPVPVGQYTCTGRPLASTGRPLASTGRPLASTGKAISQYR